MWPRIVGVGGNNASLFPLQVVYGEDVKVVLRGIEGIEGQSRVESVAHGRVIMAEAAPPHAVVSLAWLCDFVSVHCLCTRNCLDSRYAITCTCTLYGIPAATLSTSQPRHLLDIVALFTHRIAMSPPPAATSHSRLSISTCFIDPVF